MALRLALCAALVANILVLVICNDKDTDGSIALNKNEETQLQNHSSAYSYTSPINTRHRRKTKPKKCRKKLVSSTELTIPFPSVGVIRGDSGKIQKLGSIIFCNITTNDAIPKPLVKPKKCPKDEEYNKCPQSIGRPQYCSEEHQSQSSESDESCEPGCVCKEDYLRVENGTCVPKDQCDVTCGENEVLNQCPGTCDFESCPTRDKENEGCIGPAVCLTPRCSCGFNYRRAQNQTCIPTTSCPPFPCDKPNEEYNPCPPLCPTDDCSQASPSGECPPLFGIIGIVLDCNPTCRCIKGYWRKDGVCVPYGECPGVCPKNERYSGCVQGECRALNCTQKDQPISCRRIDPKFCIGECVCEENYLRAEDGTCVPEDQCPTNICPTNEEYVQCIQGVCRAKNCSEKGQVVPCPDLAKEQCESGCICKEGFLRSTDGACVPEDQCSHACPVNEEWSDCAQAICRAQNCTQKGMPIACPMIAEGFCIKACVCQENYLRDDRGFCIPENQCPGLKCGENEVLDNCSKSCTSDYCPKSADEPQGCVQSDPCQPQCKCRFNHRRAANGTCLDTRSCPPFDCCGRPNEEYNPCPESCPTDECTLPRVRGKCPFRIGIIQLCNPKCQCKDGYGRVNGTCVPFKDCPNLCPVNEEYSPCTQATCRPQTCADRDDTNIAYPTVDQKSCTRGCVCKKNFYRNEKGKCISYKECGEKDESRMSSKHLHITSEKFNCAENKVEPGCVYQSGFLRLNETLPCIPKCQCPQIMHSAQCSPSTELPVLS